MSGTVVAQAVANTSKLMNKAEEVLRTATALSVIEKLKTHTPNADYIDSFQNIVSDTFIPQNPNYVVTITKKTNEGNLMVKGVMPKDFSIQHQNDGSELSTLASNAIPAGIGNFLGRAGTLSAAVMGANLARYGNFLLWAGSHPLQFNLNLRFDAYKNPRTEVIGPIATLLRMSAPAAAGPALVSPWPTLIDVAKTFGDGENFITGLNNTIKINIGTAVTLAGLVIENIEWKWSAKAHRGTGLPTTGEANISFKSIIAYSQSEYLTMTGSGFLSASDNTLNTRADRRQG